jgi:Zn-dependent peptidase ImmA (M78 family)
MASKYPTRKQILATKPKINKKTIEITLKWKNEFLKGWKTTPKEKKILYLKYLIIAINESRKKYEEISFSKSNADAYSPVSQRIYLNSDKPSILSALHELGHHLFGSSELTACRWSVWLFKTCFPGLYKELKWDKHLLVKK